MASIPALDARRQQAEVVLAEITFSCEVHRKHHRDLDCTHFFWLPDTTQLAFMVIPSLAPPRFSNDHSVCENRTTSS
ncbi:hypothetical protein [Ktedonobacter racemifer]|uniref:Uncharacterized protein n=1 Tax=Ktedonobacter racemifer DSM 44963 TaxID=485913 RepID=D6TY15_KTERA|nr:hypothetical protein [Ktedonobacter racemifer]EFH85011.1 hypothetical protein Krac_6143 [Ktedonobacter racemifer DSM 44963]